MADNISVGNNSKPIENVESGQPQAQAQSIVKQPGVFRKAMAAVTGGALNLIAPGAGTAISSLISGGLGSESAQYLALQQKMQSESRQFEAMSAVLKARHDAAMAAIRNMH